MKTLKKAQFDEILNNPENKILSNKSSYKKDPDTGEKFHQTVVKYQTKAGKKITAVREVDIKGAQFYEL